VRKFIKCFLSLFFFFCVLPVFADKSGTGNKIQTTEEILALAHEEHPTNCASEIFSNALLDNANKVSSDKYEDEVRLWAKQAMSDADVLEKILNCPEIKNISDDTTIVFTPVVYEFPDSNRTITINYSTQPKVLKQKLILARKPSLPTNDANPKLMDPNDPAKYLNTEPSWYAIMVVQHDSLKDFVGPGKNNTLSMHYLNDHIDEIYPHGYFCTSRSAIANDSDTINNVVRRVVNVEDDSNDYYVAGDINLEWVMYAEIAAEIIITIVSFGTGEIANGIFKGIRLTKDLEKIGHTLRGLMKLDKVKEFLGFSRQIAKHADDIAKIEKQLEYSERYAKLLKKIDKGGDVAKYEKEAKEILEAAKKIDPKATKFTQTQTKSLADIDKNIARFEKQIADLQGKNPSKAKELRIKIKDQTYKRNKILNQAEKNNSTDMMEMLKNPDKLKEERQKLKETIKTLEKQADDLAKTDKNVKQYKELSKIFSDGMKYRRELRALTRPQTGNIITRAIKSIKSVNTGSKTLNKVGRAARSGMSSRSAKMGHWLKEQTFKFGSRLGKFESKVGLLYGAAAILGDMFDKTSTTSKEFSNGIEFKPFCLLSADDLEGQDNVVNYGMWLMWTGNSIDEADDDAAYLQAMDFASKFFYQLDEYQDELPPVKIVNMMGAPQPVPRSMFLCNVDIYVVHPLIRLDESDTDDPKGELYYLFMNEIPWTTAEQFGEAVPDIEDWERNQKQMTEEDGHNKNPKQKNENQQQTNTDTTENAPQSTEEQVNSEQ